MSDQSGKGMKAIDNIQTLLLMFIHQEREVVTDASNELIGCEWIGVDVVFEYSEQYNLTVPFARYLCGSKESMRKERYGELGWEWIRGNHTIGIVSPPDNTWIPITDELSEILKNQFSSNTEEFEYAHSLIEAMML